MRLFGQRYWASWIPGKPCFDLVWRPIPSVRFVRYWRIFFGKLEIKRRRTSKRWP